MKKITLLILLMAFIISAKSQTCEERETKLLQSMRSFSAAVLYNTYAVIGSISDGYATELYTNDQLKNLLNAQQKLMDNLSGSLDELKEKKIWAHPSDSIFYSGVVLIMKGLHKQSALMLDYSKSKTPQRLEAYELQRNNNWSEISKLMGLKE